MHLSPRVWIGLWLLVLGTGPALAQPDQAAGTFDLLQIVPNEQAKVLYLVMEVRDARAQSVDREAFNNANIRVLEWQSDTSQWMEVQGVYLAQDPSLELALDTGTHVLAVWADRFKPDLGRAIIQMSRNGAEVYRGEARKMQVSWQGQEVEQTFFMGTPSNPLNFSANEANNWIVVLLTGLLIIEILLTLASQAIPLSKRLHFKRKFVKPYKAVKEAGRRRFDPYTSEEFEENEMVVTRCRVMHSLDTWEYLGNQCIEFPKCTFGADPCKDGEIMPQSRQFFEQHEAFRKLNWMWFGAFGGMLAWTLWAVLKLLDPVWYRSLIASVSSLAGMDQYTYYLSKDTLMGLSLGAGLAFALSWATERGQSNKLSWGRVGLRTLAGALLGLALFFGGFFVLRRFLSSDYLGGTLTWVLFGLGLGAVLSLRSSIGTMRGMTGGVIAGLIAYNIFVGLSLAFDAFEMAKMVAFIVLGAVLGLIVVTVVSRLEDFELEYISPQKYARVNPISKWLKADMDIFIGSDASNYVFVKWHDPEVQARHAKLSYKNGEVLLEPHHETLVNGKVLPLNKPYSLQDGDIIQLGMKSISRMRFKEKRGETKPVTKTAARGAAGSPGIKISRRQ
ncbi:MAG: FHA domain-containing protein [Bacteroidetes bacterium]|nr:MAG: FHA domain-containing protein [Bacteroidota bacterium]